MDYLLKSSVVIAVFYICYYIFLKRETFFNHNRWFLLTGLLVAILFPMIIIPVYVIIEPQPITQQLNTITETSSIIINEAKDPFEWTSLIIGIYTIGLALFLIQFLFQFGSLIWLLFTNPKNKDGIYTYVIVNIKVSPFSFFKWIVYNPKSFSKTELELMLTHEKVHASQMHSIDILLAQLTCSIFWFNPFIWLYRKDIRQNLEYIADYNTQSITTKTKEYQHLLLKTSLVEQKNSLSNKFYNSSIKKRIVMLQKSRSKRKILWKYLSILPVLAGLLMSMNTETVFVPAEDYMTMEPSGLELSDNKHIEILFDKDTSDEQIDKIKSELKSNGITMIVNRLKRNSKGEISDINIDFVTNNGSANYNINDDNGIKPFYFKVEDDGSFGVGPQNRNEVILIEEIHSGHSKKDNKPNVLIYKNGDKNEVIEVIEDSTGIYKINQKAGNTFIIKEDHKVVTGKHKDHDTIRVVTGYSKTPENDSLNVFTYKINDSTEVIKTFKIKTDNYFQNSKNVKIIGTDKNIDIISPRTNSANVRFFSNDGAKPLIIINGERISSDLLNSINPEQIDSMTVLKGDDATSIYGKKAKNGVIIIKLKDFEKTKSTWTEKDEDGPWKISTNVTGYSYYYDEDSSKNATLGIVTKTTPDKVLDENKTNLEKLGITVNYSKLKRNKSGEITSLKISLKNGNGAHSSSTYKDNDGIAKVEYGLIGDKLVIRSMD